VGQLLGTFGAASIEPRFGGVSFCAPSMGAILEVKVLPRAGHSERSEAQLREGDRAWETAAEQRQRVALHALVLAALAATAFGLMWTVARRTTVSLNQALQVAESVAEGDLRSRVQAQGRDEAGCLLQAMERMSTQLAEVVGNVRRNAESVASASLQISQGNSDLSRRTEQQASALEETAASAGVVGVLLDRRDQLLHEGHQRQLQEDRRHHQRHRRHRIPDQHPGIECRSGSRAGRQPCRRHGPFHFQRLRTARPWSARRRRQGWCR